MSELPHGWSSATISDLARIGTGGTPKRSESRYYVGGAIPWVTSSAVNSERVTEAYVHITEEALRDTNCKIYPPGTLLLAMYGEGKTRGKISELRIAAATNQALAAIQLISEDVDRNYIRLFLASKYLAIRADAAGGVQPNLNLAIVGNIDVPLAPTREQHRIVAKLNSLRVRSARARHELDPLPKLIERYKWTILGKAFSGELTRDWRNTLPTSSDPEHSTVGAVAEITSGVGFPKNRQGKTTGEFPFAKVSDISRAVAQGNGQLAKAANFVDHDDLASLRAKPVPPGSTVFAKIGEALRLNRRALTLVPLVLDNNCMALSPDTTIIRPAYLYYFMQTVDLSPFAVATAVPSVRRGDVANLRLLLPTLREQDEILHRVGVALTWLDKIEADFARADRLLPKLEQAILAKGFRGELVPQDPKDEPATVLLERIKAETDDTLVKRRRSRST
jgi:type I restriction enzyme S subunit